MKVEGTKTYVDHNKDVIKGAIFVSQNNGHSFLSKKDLDLVSSILVPEPILENLDKIKVLPKLDKRILTIIEKEYRLSLDSFENFFVTGTNGKTTAAHFLSQILFKNKINNGLMGTLGSFINCKQINQQRLTTETPIFIRNFLRVNKENKIKHILYEASSIGIEKERLFGLPVSHCGFTNFTRDHLDQHLSMKHYLNAKLKLVERAQKTFAYNADDPMSDKWLSVFSGQDAFAISSANPNSDIYFEILKRYSNGLIEFKIETPWGSGKASAMLFADFNITNLLIGLPYFINQELTLDNFLSSIKDLELPDGRQKLLKYKRNSIFIDYAHTPDAIEKLLSNLTKIRPSKLTLIIGAGGDRDHGKRKLMGNVSSKYADHIVITSDNPRNESPQAIAEMIKEGIEKSARYEIILDRAEAISSSISNLTENEILVIVGKGHESYQINGNRKEFFSDEEEVRRCIGLKG